MTSRQSALTRATTSNSTAPVVAAYPYVLVISLSLSNMELRGEDHVQNVRPANPMATGRAWKLNAYTTKLHAYILSDINSNRPAGS